MNAVRPQPLSFSRLVKAALALSFLTAAVLVLQLHDTLPGHAWMTSLAFALYPAIRFSRRNDDLNVADTAYLVSLTLSLGGILAYSSAYPVGFGDVFAHHQIIHQYLDDGFITGVLKRISKNFIGYYAYVALVVELLGISIASMARFAPLFTFTTAVLIFHHFIARRVLVPHLALIGTLLFLLRYGVFRFNIEFRTLNVAFPLLMLLFALLIWDAREGVRSRRFLAIAIIATFTAATSHFASIVLFLIIAMMFVVAGVWRHQYQHPAALLLIGGLTAYFYMIMMGSFDGLVAFKVTSILQPSIDPGNRVSSGLAGTTYGPALFYITWILRFAFIAAGIALGLRWLFGNRDPFRAALFGVAGILGVLAFGASFGANIVGLNSGRYLTYFAPVYALIFVEGWQVIVATVRRISPDIPSIPVRRIQQLAVVSVVVLSMLAVVPKFPAHMIGPTEPLHSNQANPRPLLDIDDSELESRSFAYDYFSSPVNITYTRDGTLPWYFYENAIERGETPLRLDPGGEHYHLDTNLCQGSQIYANGDVMVCRP